MDGVDNERYNPDDSGDCTTTDFENESKENCIQTDYENTKNTKNLSKENKHWKALYYKP